MRASLRTGAAMPAALCCALWLGCGSAGPGGTELQPYQSGTRLRAVIFRGGGATAFIGWHDKLFDEDCAYATADDGQTRCLPHSVALQQNAMAVYLDASCTQLAYVIPHSTPINNLKHLPGVVYVSDACDYHNLGLSMFDALPVIPGSAATQWYDLAPDGSGGTACVGVISDFTARDIYPTGAKVPAAQFVAVTTSDEPRGSRLAARFWVGDDGSRQLFEIEDTARGASCSMYGIESGPCLPFDDKGLGVGLIDNLFFGDASCATSVVYAIKKRSDCPNPTAAAFDIFAGQQLACNDPDVYSIGSAIAPESIYASNYNQSIMSSMCVLYQPPRLDDHYFWAVGPIMPPGSFARLVTSPAGTGSLRGRYIATEAGDRFMSAKAPFFDPQYQESCNAMDFCDGTLRCLPTSAIVATVYYADANCTTKVAEYQPPPCPPKQPSIFVRRADCGMEAFSLGAEIPLDTIFYKTDTGACVGEAAIPAFHYLALGAPIAPSAFQQLELIVE